MEPQQLQINNVINWRDGLGNDLYHYCMVIEKLQDIEQQVGIMKAAVRSRPELVKYIEHLERENARISQVQEFMGSKSIDRHISMQSNFKCAMNRYCVTCHGDWNQWKASMQANIDAHSGDNND